MPYFFIAGVTFAVARAFPIQKHATPSLRECERVGAPFASVRAGELKRVLIVHNHYKHRGGEDAVVEDECRLLTDHGIQVTSFEHSNDELDGMNLLWAGFDTVWNARIAREFDEVIGREQPGIVHVHNTFTRISPAIYWIAARRGVPVVQTLHNFRLFCPQSTFLRNGHVCENCIKQFVPVSGIRHGCYHNSKSQTFAVAAMLVAHRAIGTWRHKVTRFIALNEFCRSKFIEGGLPADKIRVKPNFVMPPSLDVSFERRGGLFVGRLSPEKGLDTLAKAVARSGHNPISVIGTGLSRDWYARHSGNHIGDKSHPVKSWKPWRRPTTLSFRAFGTKTFRGRWWRRLLPGCR